MRALHLIADSGLRCLDLRQAHRPGESRLRLAGLCTTDLALAACAA